MRKQPIKQWVLVLDASTEVFIDTNSHITFSAFVLWLVVCAIDYLLIGPGSSRLVEQLHRPGVATTHASNQHCDRWTGVWIKRQKTRVENAMVA